MQKTKIGHLGITKETLVINREGREILLHRIIALMDFQDVKKGQKGGFAEKIENVQDLAWVGGDAKIYDYAIIGGLSRITGCTELFNKAEIMGEVDVNGDCKIYGKATINGSFIIMDNVIIKDNVSIRGLGRIVGNITISEKFRSISRIIISAYDRAIQLKGNGTLGSGWYVGKSIKENQLLHLCGKI
jgi:acyl-[acyl carrier protein]--UDP-N-acetylglucosamine O-acyltransferase